MQLAESEQPGVGRQARSARPRSSPSPPSSAATPAQDREDLLATAVAAYLVLLGAHARGLAGYWRTVPLLDDPRGREILGLARPRRPSGCCTSAPPSRSSACPSARRSPRSSATSTEAPPCARSGARRRGAIASARAGAEARAARERAARKRSRTLRPPRGDRHGPLVPLLVALTFLTGVVDATSYLKLGHVFVANMTGNVVFLGFALAGAGGLSAQSPRWSRSARSSSARPGGGYLGARNAEHRGRLLRAASVAAVHAVLASRWSSRWPSASR